MSQFLAILSVQSKIGFDEYHSIKSASFVENTLIHYICSDQNTAADMSSLRYVLLSQPFPFSEVL